MPVLSPPTFWQCRFPFFPWGADQGNGRADWEGDAKASDKPEDTYHVQIVIVLLWCTRRKHHTVASIHVCSLWLAHHDTWKPHDFHFRMNNTETSNHMCFSHSLAHYDMKAPGFARMAKRKHLWLKRAKLESAILARSSSIFFLWPTCCTKCKSPQGSEIAS